MYGLPKDFDASIFVGHELTQICFTANTIDFAFGDDIAITLTSSFKHSSATNDWEHTESVPVSSSTLMRLIGKRVTSADAVKDGTLTLSFETKERLTFLDDSRDYESYSIRIGEKEIIV
jgi:hypothetical protein